MIRWEAPGPYEVVFSTRVGGVSEGPFASLNLGRATADDPERVDENRRRLCAAIGAEPDRLVLNYQQHAALVHRAVAGARDERGDGLVTDEPGVPLLALSADCLPVVLVRADGTSPALAVLHAGWRGLLGGIVEAGVRALGRSRLVAGIGPGIGPCCYEVGEEVAGPFRVALGKRVVGRGKLDLWAAAEQLLRAAGVEQVERQDLCTACHPELFFSHRRDGGITGRQGVLGLVR